MSLTFSDIVDGIRQLPVEGKAELRELLDHELIAAHRTEINSSHTETLAEWERGDLKPTSNVDEIMRRLNAA
jgi:DNA-binding transcriptional regulator YiaG